MQNSLHNIDWRKVSPSEIKTTYFDDFAKIYLETFGEKLSKGCKGCLMEKHLKLLQKLYSKQMENLAFSLKKKYQGIQFDGKVYNNGSTLKEALYLLDKHPAKENLFDVVPVKEVREKVKKETATQDVKIDE
jgi:hypothetical protein